MAQVLGNLGTSTNKSKNNLEKDLKLGSSSKPTKDFPDTEMSFPYDTTPEEFIFEERNPLEQIDNLEETEGQPSTGRNEEDLEIPHRQK
jgi:hypothetical protein